jgi:hypothetical protein
MKFSEILIVYLACGSPFAVNYLFAVSQKSAIYTSLSTAMVLCLWPARLVTHLIRVTERAFVSDDYSHDTGELDSTSRSKVYELRSTLERMLFPNGRSSDRLQFREMVERYCGLAFAKSEFDRPHSVERNELAWIAHHPNPRLAEICINRRNEKRIRAHFAASSEDLFTTFSGSMRSSLKSRQIAAVAEELAELLGDRVLADQIRTLRPIPIELAETPEPLHV